MIHTAVTLTGDLARRRWGSARYRVRMLVARAGPSQPPIQVAAVALLDGRDAAIYPKATV